MRALSFALIFGLVSTAASAITFSGEINLASGERVSWGERGNPYKGKYLYTMTLKTAEKVELLKVEAGTGYIVEDPDISKEPERYCWSSGIYNLGELVVTVSNRAGKVIGTESSMIRASVTQTRDYEENCPAKFNKTAKGVSVEAKDLYNATMLFNVKKNVTLETHLLMVYGVADLEDGHLTNFNFGEDKGSVQWFAYDSNDPNDRSHLESLVSGSSEIFRK